MKDGRKPKNETVEKRAKLVKQKGIRGIMSSIEMDAVTTSAVEYLNDFENIFEGVGWNRLEAYPFFMGGEQNSEVDAIVQGRLFYTRDYIIKKKVEGEVGKESVKGMMNAKDAKYHFASDDIVKRITEMMNSKESEKPKAKGIRKLARKMIRKKEKEIKLPRPRKEIHKLLKEIAQSINENQEWKQFWEQRKTEPNVTDALKNGFLQSLVYKVVLECEEIASKNLPEVDDKPLARLDFTNIAKIYMSELKVPPAPIESRPDISSAKTVTTAHATTKLKQAQKQEQSKTESAKLIHGREVKPGIRDRVKFFEEEANKLKPKKP